MLKSKKAAIEVQFNWIFVLIAGALIIGFFVMIVSKQQTSVKSEINIVVSRAIEAILTGSKVSADSASPGSLPVGNIEFDCDSYSVGDVERKLKQMTVFAPDLIKGKQIITWSLPWNVPFRATNLLLLTSPQVRYIFVYDHLATDDLNVFAGKLHDKMLEQLKFKKIEANVDRIKRDGVVTNTNNYKVKFIYFNNQNDANLAHLSGVDVTAVDVAPLNPSYDPDDGSHGSIEFYEGSGTNWGTGVTDNFYNEATIYAAIFAENQELYECVITKELQKLKRTAEVLRQRSDKLNLYYTSGDCDVHHLEAKSRLGNMVSNPTISSIKIEAPHLISLNTDAEYDSCALIY